MAVIKDKKIDEQIHHGRRQKLRDSLVKNGLASFNETQVIEYALGIALPRIDTNPLAHRLINRFGSLRGVVDAHPDKLREVAGVGEQCAVFLSFLKQFVTYYQTNGETPMRIKTPAAAVDYLRALMSTFTTEQFMIICLDNADKVILKDTFSSGELNKVYLNVREVNDVIMRVKTASVIFAHNHLGENVNPSDADLQFTRAMLNSLTLMSIELRDHLIFGPNNAVYSFEKSGMLGFFRREVESFITSRDYEDMY